MSLHVVDECWKQEAGRCKPEPQCIFDNRAANEIGLAYRISGVLG